MLLYLRFIDALTFSNSLGVLAIILVLDAALLLAEQDRRVRLWYFERGQ